MYTQSGKSNLHAVAFFISVLLKSSELFLNISFSNCNNYLFCRYVNAYVIVTHSRNRIELLTLVFFLIEKGLNRKICK